MKTVKLLCVVALLSISAAATQAGSIPPGGDPKISINKPGKVGPTPSPLFRSLDLITFSANSLSDPLIINGGDLGKFDFEYIGTTPLTHLFVEVNPDPCPGLVNLCYQGDTTGPLSIFTKVKSGFTNTNPAFPFFDFSGGRIIHDQQLVVDVVGTPEPSSILLFLSLGPAIGFARRRWATKRA